MKFIARTASAESLKGIGIFATPIAGKAPDVGAEHVFELTALDLGMPAGLCAGRLECVARARSLVKMERHLRTPEMLSAVDGDAVLCVAPPQEPREGKLNDLRAILLRRGQTVVLAKGAWHWIPFPTGPSNVHFMVVFRNGTGEDDLHICDLADFATIDIPQGL
jgi:ureidoglycolate hydrolase